MPKTKGAEAAAKNWQNSISRVPANYKAGVERTTDFKSAAIAGESNYVSGVTRAASEGSRRKALEAMDERKWQSNASAKGSQRIAQGMTQAADRQRSQIGKVIEVIEGTNLTPRTTDLRQNVQRVLEQAEALQNAKRQGRFL